MVARISEELCNQLRKKVDLKIAKNVRQQLDGLLATVLESRIQSSLTVAQTDWTALLEKKWRR